MLKMIRRKLILGTCLLSAIPALAAYPEKPIKLIVPYAAGSPADALSRIIGDELSKRLSQSVVVENKPGANAMIGSGTLAKSAADGYTIGLGTSDTMSINPNIYKKISYDAAKDFAPIVNVARFNMVLVARPNLDVKGGEDLISEAKKSPGKLSYGTWGLGSLAHLWAMQLEKSASIKMMHVPFQGSPAALQALMGDQIDMMFMLPNVAVQTEKTGKVKIIGSTSSERLPDFPEIRTLAEQGFKNFSGAQWMALFAPAGTPSAVLDRINNEVNAFLKDPSVTAKLAGLSMYAEGGKPNDLKQLVSTGSVHWQKLLTENNFKPLD